MTIIYDLFLNCFFGFLLKEFVEGEYKEVILVQKTLKKRRRRHISLRFTLGTKKHA